PALPGHEPRETDLSLSRTRLPPDRHPRGSRQRRVELTRFRLEGSAGLQAAATCEFLTAHGIRAATVKESPPTGSEPRSSGAVATSKTHHRRHARECHAQYYFAVIASSRAARIASGRKCGYALL